MGARGNLVVRFDDDQRIYLYTHWKGRDLQRVLANVLERWPDRRAEAATLCNLLAAELRKAGGDAHAYCISPARILPDHDEWHVVPERGEVVRVALDCAWRDGALRYAEREVERCSYETFLAKMGRNVGGAVSWRYSEGGSAPSSS